MSSEAYLCYHLLYEGSSGSLNVFLVPLVSYDPWFVEYTSCRWPLLTDCWFCCRSSAGRRAVWTDTSLRAPSLSPPLLTRRPPTQQQETPGTRGFPDHQIKPTHSLSASDMLLYLHPPPSSVDWTSLWVTMKFWSMSTTEHIDQKGKKTTLTSSPCPELCFFVLITGADASQLINFYWLRMTSHNFML